ncbi:hypothetical protein [Massilia sp. TS11]|uniref:glycine-rich domain-containing protein n=1 Tax=Massilia sp. TS11 TaxID=2908003 RepID=UPI001EDBC9E1|nr:hypothetical protein [Massilia sp. TS11]MCG2585715.1 hypothetical protein [Massilia sp. TS11]
MIANEDFQAIAALNLDPIKVKLMHEESGEGWTRAQADAVEFEYRRFLYLMKTFPNEPAAPSMQVDTFWHYHILDTMAYAQDCAAVFGYFLHHFPYIGLRGEADLEAHHEIGNRMKELYEATFGEAYGAREHAAFAAEAGAAFSAVPVQAAFSAVPVKSAFSAVPVKSAFSAVPVQAAFSAVPVKSAFSAVPVKGAFSAAQVQTAFSAVPTDLSRFYSERPRLQAA